MTIYQNYYSYFRYINDANDYFKYVQTDIKPHMRKIVTDWMLEVKIIS